MVTPLLTDDLLEELRTAADPEAYDRLLSGSVWKNGRLSPGRKLKASRDVGGAMRMLELLADAPVGSKLAPTLRADAPSTMMLAGPGALDLRVLRGFIALDTLLHTLGALPGLKALMTRAVLDDDLAPLATHAPQLEELSLLREQPKNLATLGPLPLTSLRLNVQAPRLAELPSLAHLRHLSITTLAPNDVGPLPEPFDLSISAELPELATVFIVGPVRSLGRVPPTVTSLRIELAPAFEVTDDAVVPSLEKLDLKSAGADPKVTGLEYKLDFLRRFPNLKHLDLGGTGFRSLAPLAHCPKLAKVRLDGLDPDTDARYLAAHPEIELGADPKLRAALGLPPRAW